MVHLETGKLQYRKRKTNDEKKLAHTNPVICVKDTTDSNKIVSMSLNRTLNCWDAHSFKFQNSVEVCILYL